MGDFLDEACTPSTVNSKNLAEKEATKTFNMVDVCKGMIYYQYCACEENPFNKMATHVLKEFASNVDQLMGKPSSHGEEKIPARVGLKKRADETFMNNYLGKRDYCCVSMDFGGDDTMDDLYSLNFDFKIDHA